jgi:hypothetical protein
VNYEKSSALGLERRIVNKENVDLIASYQDLSTDLIISA